MFSARRLTRALPRVSSRLSQTASRRTITALRKPSRLSKASSIVSISPRAAFSTGLPRFQDQAGSVDGELSAKFESERQLEIDASPPTDELPPHLKEYLDTSPWQLHDTPGEEEVTLTRSFGKEKIKVTFTVADLNYDAEQDSYAEDPAMYDEDSASMQQGGAQSKGTINQGRTSGGNINVAPEDRIAPADREELADDESPATAAGGGGAGTSGEQGFPTRLHLTIEKEGVKGALHIESIVRDGDILTENLHYFPAAELADAKTAEQDWNRRALYTGPPFANLDEDLQVLIDRFVQERGIDTALAVWVPDYVDYKEQREYVNWLSDVKGFIDA